MMKIYSLCITLILFTSASFGQKKSTIKIHYFDKLGANDKEQLLEIEKKVFKSKRYNIQLISVYDNLRARSFEVSKKTPSQDPFKYLPSSIENLKFKTNRDYENILNSGSWTYDFDKSDENFIVTSGSDRDIKELKKSLKKEKKKIKKGVKTELNLFWLNKLVDYKFGEKNLNKVYGQKKNKNELKDLIPLITEPSNRQQIRPNEDSYIIKFDSVGYYDKYEIEIKSTSRSMNKIIYKETFEFEKNMDGDYLIYTGDRKRCEIFLNLQNLAKTVYRLSKETIHAPEVTLEKDCECELEVLYSKQYSLRIRGIVDGFAKEDLWDEIELFQFQCPKQ